MTPRLDKKGREKCSYYIGGGCHCDHTAVCHEDGEPRCGTHTKKAAERRAARFADQMATKRAIRESLDARWRAREAVLKAAREWSKAARDSVIGSSPSKLGPYAGAVHDAVDALLALKSEGA